LRLNRKIDRRQHVLRFELLDDLVRLWLQDLGALAPAAAATLLATLLAADAGEVRDVRAGVVDHRMHLAVVEEVKRQRHRPGGVGDEADRPVGAADPPGDLVGIGDGGGQADELDVLRAEDDRLFPGRAAVGIGVVWISSKMIVSTSSSSHGLCSSMSAGSRWSSPARGRRGSR